MIYAFTGNSSYLIKQELLRWKEAFGNKHGTENITHISSIDTSNEKTISNDIFGRSLFNQTRLVIIEGIPFGGETTSTIVTNIENSLINIIETIPEETIIIFASVNPDKRKSFYKKLVKTAQVKDFSTNGESDVYGMLSKKFGNSVDEYTLKRVIALKSGNLQKSISEIEKLLITHTKLSIKSIEENISPEFEESIFNFINSLLQKNAKGLFKEFHTLLDNSNLYALYQSLIANIRTHVYIELLKSQKKAPREIIDILKLGNRGFLVEKQHKTSYKKIETLYVDLLNFDKNMKFGKLISSDEDFLKKELEFIFLKFMS